MEQQEKKLIADMKKMAKDNQMESVKIMARDLVRTRRYSIFIALFTIKPYLKKLII